MNVQVNAKVCGVRGCAITAASPRTRPALSPLLVEHYVCADTVAGCSTAHRGCGTDCRHCNGQGSC